LLCGESTCPPTPSPQASEPDTGDLGTDLRARLCELATFLTATARAAVRALAGQDRQDPGMARLQSESVTAQRDLDRLPFLHAAASADIELAMD
jgi:hypothetical protein